MTLPATLSDIREDFLSLPASERLNLLLEFSRSLPAIPERLSRRPELFVKIPECQSPLRILVELDGDRATLHALAPAEAPTTRGFASVVAQGARGAFVEEILAIPADFSHSLGLTQLVSPLRLVGMTALIARFKRLVRAEIAARL